MQALVNGTRLWFDVEGAGLVADGPRMRAKPTLILLHGGPGFDHSYFKPFHSVFADVAQIVYVGNCSPPLSTERAFSVNEIAFPMNKAAGVTQSMA